MVISVFNTAPGFQAYQGSRRARLQDQALRTEQEAMARRQAAFNNMLGQIQDPQQRSMLEAMGVQGAPAFYEMQQRQQAAQAEADATRRQAVNEYGNTVATRMRAQGIDPNSEQGQAFLQNAYAYGQETLGMQMPPELFVQRVINPMAGDLPEQRSSDSEFERGVDALLESGDITQAEASQMRRRRLERLASPSGQSITVSSPVDPNALRVDSPEERAALGISPDDRRAYFYDVDRNGRITGASPVGDLPEPEQEVDENQILMTARQVSQYQDSQIEDLETIIDQVESWPIATVGLGSGVAEQIRGTPAANVVSLLDSVTGAVALERLDNLRQIASESGARGSGLGQVTEREIAILRAARGALSADQDPALFMRQARRLLTQLREVRADRRRILQSDFPEVYNQIYGGGARSEDDEIDEIQAFFEDRLGAMGPQ